MSVDDDSGVGRGLESERHLVCSDSGAVPHDNAFHSLLLYEYLGPPHVISYVTDESISTVRAALPVV